jgi:electron transfer flavoprotein-quinone oxidoreductase
LGFKQLISLPPETINARFGLADNDHGLAVSVMGDVSMGLLGEGFVYTGKDCVSIGLGVNLNQLADNHVRPYELLQRFLDHPVIAPLVAGGKLMEYGGHLIPEGGWRDMPKLYTDGVLVAGDAASMVNSLHWEGTNMAIVAGKLAAETAVQAVKSGDPSATALSAYREKLKDRFILQDLHQYRRLPKFLDSHPDFMNVYPASVNDALGRFFTGYGRPKRDVYREIMRSFSARRPLHRAFMDLVSFGRTVIGW